MTEPFTQAAGEKIVLIADEDASGRLDAWIAAALEGQLSRNRIQTMIGEGAVIDYQFGTTDVLIIFPVAQISDRYMSKFGGKEKIPSGQR